jgi:hypothetical protein
LAPTRRGTKASAWLRCPISARPDRAGLKAEPGGLRMAD